MKFVIIYRNTFQTIFHCQNKSYFSKCLQERIINRMEWRISITQSSQGTHLLVFWCFYGFLHTTLLTRLHTLTNTLQCFQRPSKEKINLLLIQEYVRNHCYLITLNFSFPTLMCWRKPRGLLCLGVRMVAKLLILGKVCLIQCTWHQIFQIKVHHFFRYRCSATFKENLQTL